MAKVTDMVLVAGIAAAAYFFFSGVKLASEGVMEGVGGAIRNVTDVVTFKEYRTEYSEKLEKNREWLDINPRSATEEWFGGRIDTKVFEPHPNAAKAYDTGKPSVFADIGGFLLPTQLNIYNRELLSVFPQESRSGSTQLRTPLPPTPILTGKMEEIRRSTGSGSSGSGSSGGTTYVTLKTVGIPGLRDRAPSSIYRKVLGSGSGAGGR